MDSGLDEDSFRAALNRLGSQRAPSNPAPRPTIQARSSGEQSGRLSLHGGNAEGSLQQRNKRRFVRDGDIPVERQTLSRSTARTTHFGESESIDLPQHRRALEEERRLRENAERQIHDLEASQRAMTTRLGHAEILVTELKQTLATRDQELADRTSELANERTLRDSAEEEIRQLKVKLRATPKKPAADLFAIETDTMNEPQPVKWWKD